MAHIEHEFPYVTVGVAETSPRQPTHRFDDWASLRSSALTQPLLVKETGFGAEGGIYQSRFGTWTLDESGRELTFKLDATATNAATGFLTSDAVARYLLSLSTPGNPSFRGDIASLLQCVSISGNSVALHLKRVHVRPESLFQVPPPTATTHANGDPSSSGDFTIADYTPNQVVFAATQSFASESGKLRAIVEETLPSDEAAFTALRNGDVDVLDRVPPWQLERLRSLSDIRVGTYKLPTVHVLIPNLKRPLLAKREFRRALCYGIDRKWIVNRVLSGGATMPGFEPISGPFPTGTSLGDPIRYAYNSQIDPRPFEPRLASILSTIAWAGVQKPPDKNTDVKAGASGTKNKTKSTPVLTDIPELTLAYPSDPVARLACQSIQAQLARRHSHQASRIHG